MIQNFNFYDIYGYLIPGMVLSILMWLPLALTERLPPMPDWTSALVAVVIAYTVGHVMQGLARDALPPTTMKGRYPSDVLLNKDDKHLSKKLKEDLERHIERLSGIHVRVHKNLDGKEADVTQEKRDEFRRQRRDGFFFCRDALIASKAISYAEHMEGTYALLAGLAAGFALAAPYHLGWALSGLERVIIEPWAWAVGLSAVLGAIGIATYGLSAAASLEPQSRTIRARAMAVFAMIGSLAAGYILGLTRVNYLAQRGGLLAVALVSLLAYLICVLGYRDFTVTYAQTIYRAFSLYEKPGAVDPESYSRSSSSDDRL